MKNSIYDIPLLNLTFAFIPVIMVIILYAKWSLPFRTIIYASIRMVIQLLLIGFALVTIFQSNSQILIISILCLMLLIASWIAIRPLQSKNKTIYGQVLFSLSLGCFFTFALVIFGVIQLKPWHEPRYLIPIAGMIFSNGMNSVSLAAERFFSEKNAKKTFEDARNAAFQAALLPLTNSFFAVGLVALPGMMTGQILSGISPLIAVRYQMMVMCMLLGAAGLSSAIFLMLQRGRNS